MSFFDNNFTIIFQLYDKKLIPLQKIYDTIKYKKPSLDNGCYTTNNTTILPIERGAIVDILQNQESIVQEFYKRNKDFTHFDFGIFLETKIKELNLKYNTVIGDFYTLLKDSMSKDDTIDFNKSYCVYLPFHGKEPLDKIPYKYSTFEEKFNKYLYFKKDKFDFYTCTYKDLSKDNTLEGLIVEVKFSSETEGYIEPAYIIRSDSDYATIKKELF